MNLSKRIEGLLPERIYSLLKWIGKMARDEGVNSFAVGGFVRDILMGAANLDIDIVIEGDAIDFAKKIAQRRGGSIKAHKKFGTATVEMDDLRLDFATARRETYKEPGALPDIEPSSLGEDLKRRDFTINSMAIALGRDEFGCLIDPFNGRRDIKRGIVSVLYRESFIDDPTRIFRAVRFKERFDFEIEGETMKLMSEAIEREAFSTISRYRIRNELLLMLKELDPEEILVSMRKFFMIEPKEGDVVMGNRPDRIREALRREVSNIIQKEIKDPRLGFTTITKVTISKDLKNATIFYSVLGKEKEIKDTKYALKSAEGYIRKLIGDRIEMRFVPDITFELDKSMEHTRKVFDILDKLKKEKNEHGKE